eukprot:6174457-Pleurochrysis_carterae.AAC.3
MSGHVCARARAHESEGTRLCTAMWAMAGLSGRFAPSAYGRFAPSAYGRFAPSVCGDISSRACVP